MSGNGRQRHRLLETHGQKKCYVGLMVANLQMNCAILCNGSIFSTAGPSWRYSLHAQECGDDFADND